MTTGGTPARICWYGDDFTGASDTLAEVARAGLRGLLFLGIPQASHLRRAGPLDAIGIAGAARGMAPAEMAAELDAVGRYAAAAGVRILHYKCCSTFDSAPHIGSIGLAVRTLRRYMPNPLIPIVGGQPGIGRYCSFGQLFARSGSAPEIHRIDRHPVMRQHPVTPMHEADLRLHLAAQGLESIASLPQTDYPAALPSGQDDAWVQAMLDRHRGPLLLDVVDERHLYWAGLIIGHASRQAPLLSVGPSSVQQALARADETGTPTPPQTPLAPADGPVLVMAGSLSPVTASQIAAARRYTRQPVCAARLSDDPGYAEQQTAIAATALARGENVLVHTDRPEQALTAAETAATARATAGLTAAMVRASAARGTRLTRVGVAGGDTSSQATLALGVWGLAFHSVLAPGVTVSVTHSDDPMTDGLELMLKGGQMGGADLFDALVDGRMV